MATPSSRLTEAHRIAQLRLGAVVVAQLRAVFRLLNPDNLDESFADWLTVVLGLIKSHRPVSESIAAGYLAALRTLHLGEPVAAVAAPAIDETIVATSLLVTGPVSIKSALARKVPLTKALDVAEARSSAAAMRHVLNAGRETILETVKADPQALGFARAASSTACAFCAMLASRGAVYKDERTALLRDDGHHYHDGCSCTVEPRYTRDAEWPAHSRDYKRQWAETTKGLHGNDALNAFRRSLAR